MAEGNNNEAMIQLPWTVPQQPLYTTHVSVDPESKKIPIDLNVSSTDWGVVGSVLLSFLAFAVTIYVVKQSTKSQIETNKALIKSQEMVKQRDIEASYIKDWKNNIIHRSAEILVGQNDFILVLRKFIKLNLQPTQFEKDIALFKQNYENLEVIAKKILSIHHILMLNFDLRTQSKKVERLDLMFCKIMWICLQKIENKEDLIFSTTEITILKDEIQKHNLDVKIDNYKNLTSDPSYHLLVEIHGKFQHEVRKLIN